MAVLETTSRYRWVILAVSFLSQLSCAMVTQGIAPLAPIVQTELGLSKAEIGMFVSAPFVGWSGVLLLGGSLADRLGTRRVMALGQVWTGLSVLSMAAVASFPHALLVMFSAGVGSGAVLPGVSKIVSEWFPRQFRATAMGLKQAAVPVAGALTASVLPAVALALGWRWALAMVSVVVIAVGVLGSRMLREARLPGQPKDRAGARAGLRHLLRNRLLWGVNVAAVLYVMVQMGVTAYLALYLSEMVLVQQIPDRAARVVASGGFLALCQSGGAFGRVFWGAASDRVLQGRRMAVMAGTGLMAAAMSLAVSALGTGVPLALLAVIVALLGASAIGWNGLYHAAMTEAAGSRYAATSVGLGMTINQIGTIGGAPIFGFLVDTSGSYQAGWLALCGFAVAGAAVAMVSAKGEKHVA